MQPLHSDCLPLQKRTTLIHAHQTYFCNINMKYEIVFLLEVSKNETMETEERASLAN
jgi:hypothetical protein